MNENSINNKKIALYIFIAYFFSVALRYVWVFQFHHYAPFLYDGQLMINTNDGYYFAEGARDILAGFHQPHDLSPVDAALSQLTAFFARYLPFSFESIILYMPTYLGSLVVIPIILIAKTLKNLELGFIAALLSSIAWSYYNRTMTGYYDTDMLNIVLPMFLLWSIIWAINTNEDKFLLIVAVDILIYRWWYPQSYALESAFFSLILLYTLVFDRKNQYNYKLLAIMLFAMLMLDLYIKALLVMVLFYLYEQKKVQKYIYHILMIAIVAYFVTGGFDPIWGKLKIYVFRNATTAQGNDLALHYFSVMQTVREAGHISFETFANRISGNIYIFIFSIIGYIYLLFKRPIMLFSLPLLGLGFLALSGGLRFTIYAVPVLAFGIAFLIMQIAAKISNKNLSYAFVLLAILSLIYPNYKHIEGYKVPTVFQNNEVAVLHQLKQIANREDYVVSWWDYGYPIRYYADLKTLIDGGKHGGSVNYPVSFLLTHPQLPAARMARLSVEFTELSYKKESNSSDKSLIAQMTKAYGLKNANTFLHALSQNIQMPKKTRDVYLYLPYRMANIYPTVSLFSDIDLETGKKIKRVLFYKSTDFHENNKMISMGNGISLNKKNATISIGTQTLPIKRFVKSSYDTQGRLHVKVQMIHPKAKISIIYNSSYHMFLVVNEATYNSLYVQLMFLNNYNKKLFEPVIMTPMAKVYKLKI